MLSCQRKPFSIFYPKEAGFPYSGDAFFNECFIQLLQKDFLFSGNCLHYLRVFSYLKTDFKDRVVFQLVETIFFHCLRYFSRSSSSRLVKTHFSVQKKKVLVLTQSFFSCQRKSLFKLQRSLSKTLINAIGNGFL